jgi:hypothetical protein
MMLLTTYKYAASVTENLCLHKVMFSIFKIKKFLSD